MPAATCFTCAQHHEAQQQAQQRDRKQRLLSGMPAALKSRGMLVLGRTAVGVVTGGC